MKKTVSVILIIAILVSMLAISSITTMAATDGLPDVVDNSKSKYFPAILSQGDQGSCVAWSQAYYQFTYEMNKVLDRESTAENCFSPSFTYNMSNHGTDTGCFPNNTYNNMKKIGVAPITTIPYNKEEYLDWFAEESIWQEAAKYRIADFKVLPNFRTGSGKHVTYPDDPDLTQIKTLLNDGHILSFGAYLKRWKFSQIKANSACPENNAYLGEAVVTATSPDIGNGYGHRMTIVGYNDNLWVDVNGNNAVDSGEMGAFKVANSYGTWWKNDGFIWLAYDNINMTTSIPGGLPYRTMSGLVDVTTITVLPYNSDADIYLRYTLNTSDRAHAEVTITAEKDGKTYSVLAGPHHEAPYMYNNVSFDGTTSSNDGTMIFMLSNVVPGITRETISDYKWSVKFEDTKADSIALTVKNAEIVDNSTGRAVKALGTFGFRLDGSSKTMTFPDIDPYIPSTTTTTPTTVPTDPTEPPTVTSEHIYGDTNDSDSISISDASLIQKFVAFIIGNDEINLANADCDGDDNVSIKDATCIQKYLAELDGYGVVGEKYTVTTIVTTPTDPTESVETTEQTESVITDPTEDHSEIVTQPTTTESTTTEPTTTEAVEANVVTFTNSFGWQGTIYCYYWSDSNNAMTSWPGTAMKNAGTNSFGETMYTLQIPLDATYVIFTNGSVQTVDIPYSGGEQRFYPVTSNNEGKYTVNTW